MKALPPRLIARVVGGEFRFQLERGKPLRRGQVPAGDAARGEAEDEIRLFPDPVDDAAEEVDVLAAEPRLGVAHVDMDDRGACLPGLDGRLGDFIRRDRDVGGDVPHHAASGDGCGDDDFFHELSSHLLLRLPDRLVQDLHQLVDLGLRDDERGGQQAVVAPDAAAPPPPG